MGFTLRAYGESGVLAVGLTEAERMWLRRAAAHGLPEGCLEVVEGYDTMLFIFEVRRRSSGCRAGSRLRRWPPSSGQSMREHRLPVVYDGADLEWVAQASGLSVEEVIRLHCAPRYTVRLLGFTPGFPYLDGLDARLHFSEKGVAEESNRALGRSRSEVLMRVSTRLRALGAGTYWGGRMWRFSMWMLPREWRLVRIRCFCCVQEIESVSNRWWHER